MPQHVASAGTLLSPGTTRRGAPPRVGLRARAALLEPPSMRNRRIVAP